MIQKLQAEKQLNLLNLKKSLSDKCVDRIRDETIKFDINEQIENATNLQLDLLRNVSLADKALEGLTASNSNVTELEQLNTQFNLLLCKLFKFVDETVRENVALQERKQDEESKIIPSVDTQAVKIQEVASVQEAPRGVLSSESEEDEEISELPPLECPEFDLDK